MAIVSIALTTILSAMGESQRLAFSASKAITKTLELRAKVNSELLDRHFSTASETTSTMQFSDENIDLSNNLLPFHLVHYQIIDNQKIIHTEGVHWKIKSDRAIP